MTELNKEPTSDLKTHIHLKRENGKIYFMQMGSTKKSEVAILISDNIDLIEDYKR